MYFFALLYAFQATANDVGMALINAAVMSFMATLLFAKNRVIAALVFIVLLFFAVQWLVITIVYYHSVYEISTYMRIISSIILPYLGFKAVQATFKYRANIVRGTI